MAQKHIGCPYCKGLNGLSPVQVETPYKAKVCQCGGHSGEHENGFHYPLVNPSDPKSGWVVYNPNH